MNISRRNVLKLGVGAAAMCAAVVRPVNSRANPPKKKKHVGLQVVSVGDQCKKDMARTLHAVAQMGYEGLELAGGRDVARTGYYGRKAEELRKMLEQCGLTCCGTHITLESLIGNAFHETVEFHKTLGVPDLTIHGLSPKHLVSVAALVDVAKLLTEIAEKLKASGMTFGYHTQVRDIRRVEGQIPIEVVLAHAGPNVHLQLDTGHCTEGGADPVAMLKKFRGRSRSVHLHEYGGSQDAILGEGDVKWKEIFEICQTDGSIEWYIVERSDFYQRPSLEIARLNLESLRKLLVHDQAYFCE
ncbi:MAG: sugar phosphate isomerase/epimerase [Planctomycetes bacterium]|nr:sugar phosphate isomerase/epimerase [Planctomycetota bacterium]MBU4398061.1 sugar phosphate isomerase/epimerase [Planctomycetota bacterium]MCG2682634.1 sugar phosphate isomerase/epimerase [Planctomycetales bacterium]